MSGLIRVVGAVAVREDRVFMARRPPGGRHGGLWEFPGGKVEPGESDAEALIRELREELQVASVVGGLVAVGSDEKVELHCYAVRFEGRPTPSVPQETGWFALKALEQLDLPPADRPVVAYLLQQGLSSASI